MNSNCCVRKNKFVCCGESQDAASSGVGTAHWDLDRRREKMRFLTISSKICVSAAVFYSTFLLSKCRANDIPGIVWMDKKIQDRNIVYIYRTEVPWTPLGLKEYKPKIAVSTIIWIAVGIGCAVYICCEICRLCYVLNSRRRQSTNAALIPSGPRAIVVQTDAAHGPIPNSTTMNNSFGNSVVNYAFAGNPQDMIPDDGPPEYFSVVSQTSTNCMPERNAASPQVSGNKTVETPPPAYISVAPFQ